MNIYKAYQVYQSIADSAQRPKMTNVWVGTQYTLQNAKYDIYATSYEPTYSLEGGTSYNVKAREFLSNEWLEFNGLVARILFNKLAEKERRSK